MTQFMQDDKSLYRTDPQTICNQIHIPNKQKTSYYPPTRGQEQLQCPVLSNGPSPHCAQQERFEVWLQQKDAQSLLHSSNAQKVLYTLANKSVCKTACFFIVKAMLTSLLPWARHCLIPKEKVAINHHVYWLTVGGFPVLPHNAGGNWHREKG